jgi:hypothetical protein
VRKGDVFRLIFYWALGIGVVLYGLAIIMSAIGDDVNTGRQSWELKPVEIKTNEVISFPLSGDRDARCFLQRTDEGNCQIGAGMDAAWYTPAGAITVPTGWVHTDAKAAVVIGEWLHAVAKTSMKTSESGI